MQNPPMMSLNNMRTSLYYSLLSVAVVALLASCSKEIVPAPSFSLRVRTVGTADAPAVLLAAVDQLEVVIRPRAPARFVPFAGADTIPRTADDGAPPGCSFDDCGGTYCCKYEDGQVATFVSAADEYVMRFDAVWVQARAEVTPTGFAIALPVYATSEMDSPGAFDPTVAGNVLHGDERIAGGEITLTWPLRGGEMRDLAIMCVAGREAECMNVDPSLPLDGGP